ncbi:hypothetical protein SteCoe_37356 [Stentor coeruleus]|uniref:C-CAP/cofactor C-like domain-containing protein n=1 Tax=Stentor coeruleus TaxID=5963 RepID=A0A1R2ANA4_9CILI|nr:hypothetical protein SteCoe_37356 [Stentor coeruleus]
MSQIPEEYIFKDKKNQTLIKMPNTINGQVFNMEKLSDCEIFILDVSEIIYIDNCTNCKFYVAPVRSAFYIRDSQSCTCSVACKQLRVKNCTNFTFFLYSASDPHIESSFDMRFAPYNFSYPGQNLDFKKAGFDENQNRWCKVYDHSSAEGDGHFSLLPSNQFRKVEKRIDGYGNPINPVPIPQQYGGDLKAEIVPGSKSESYPQPSPVSSQQNSYSPPQIPNSLLSGQNNQKNSYDGKKDEIVAAQVVNNEFQGNLNVYYDPVDGFKVYNKELPGLFTEQELKGKLEQFDEINAQYYPPWTESLFAIYMAIIGFLVVLLVMSLLKMSSEWKIEATGVFLAFVLLSVIFIIIILVVKVKRLEKAWMETVNEVVNQQNSEFFDARDAKIFANFTTLTISIGNS